ncbi:TetR family transcriptional regulator [Neptunomonas qingdaonensis]|uniref:Transcriptional regulator, TetR family n=1 Tax=Neptunomonas qingdaonensis TaxID=1045558 RepID=A0A1I2TU38_9GAMM|nr:TetR family transcriptional regulator [Neptunomonas qingdaonensis]SFG65791.1 transcriptional regulator, TetR family [Neptunomonas qingdaonensis]
MARKTKEEALKTYHLLLDAAAELFSHQGISHTTLLEIAKFTGMTRGAVYWHFENKEDVIKALWERDAAPFFKIFIAKLTDEGCRQTDMPADLYFKNTIKEMLRQVTQDPKNSQAIRITFNYFEATHDQTELQTYLESKSDAVYQALVTALTHLHQQQLLHSQHGPEFLAGALYSYLHGLIEVNLHLRLKKTDLANDADLLIDLFLNSFFVDNSSK